MRETELSPLVQVARETLRGRMPRVYDRAQSAAGLDVLTPGTMTGFAADIFRVLARRHHPRMRGVAKARRDRSVAFLALLRTDEFRPGNLRRQKQRTIHDDIACHQKQAPDGQASQNQDAASPTITRIHGRFVCAAFFIDHSRAPRALAARVKAGSLAIRANVGHEPVDFHVREFVAVGLHLLLTVLVLAALFDALERHLVGEAGLMRLVGEVLHLGLAAGLGFAFPILAVAGGAVRFVVFRRAGRAGDERGGANPGGESKDRFHSE